MLIELGLILVFVLAVMVGSRKIRSSDVWEIAEGFVTIAVALWAAVVFGLLAVQGKL